MRDATHSNISKSPKHYDTIHAYQDKKLAAGIFFLSVLFYLIHRKPPLITDSFRVRDTNKDKRMSFQMMTLFTPSSRTKMISATSDMKYHLLTSSSHGSHTLCLQCRNVGCQNSNLNIYLNGLTKLRQSSALSCKKESDNL